VDSLKENLITFVTMEIQDRLQMVMKMNNLNASQFADRIGVQRSSISHILTGRNKPSLDLIQKTLEHFPRVNADWLLTGKVKEVEEEVTIKTVVNQVNLVYDEDPAPYGNATARSSEEQSHLTKVTETKSDPEIEKIIWFYTDGSYRVFSPKD
jgi:transcriptional regulator with XRE-family HTH domain